jgi:hypothetical protein
MTNVAREREGRERKIETFRDIERNIIIERHTDKETEGERVRMIEIQTERGKLLLVGFGSRLFFGLVKLFCILVNVKCFE